ncbi:TonB-dependent siderophore receptor, partial [Acinetobacter baumannii]
IDGYLSGPFQLLGRTHELVLGGSFRRNKDDDGPGGWPTDYNVIVDPMTWDSSAVPKPAFTYTWSRKGHQRLSSAYATTRLSLADPLTLML